MDSNVEQSLGLLHIYSMFIVYPSILLLRGFLERQMKHCCNKYIKGNLSSRKYNTVNNNKSSTMAFVAATVSSLQTKREEDIYHYF